MTSLKKAGLVMKDMTANTEGAPRDPELLKEVVIQDEYTDDTVKGLNKSMQKNVKITDLLRVQSVQSWRKERKKRKGQDTNVKVSTHKARRKKQARCNKYPN